MTKEQRLQQYERDIASWDSQLTDDNREALLRIARESFSRGYKEGFSDGCTAGASHTAKTLEFVNDNLFGSRDAVDDAVTQEFRNDI